MISGIVAQISFSKLTMGMDQPGSHIALDIFKLHAVHCSTAKPPPGVEQPRQIKHTLLDLLSLLFTIFFPFFCPR